MSINTLASENKTVNLVVAPICVIGAGIAGLLVARRLARSGQRVVVVESGDESGSEASNLLNEIDDPNGLYGRSLSGRHRGLGGTSSRWGGRMIPISEHEAEARDYIAQPEWPMQLNNLAEYEDEIERLFGVAPGTHEDIPAERMKRVFPKGEVSLSPRWAKCPSFKRCNVATVLKGELASQKNLEIWLDATVCGFEVDRTSGRLAAITARNFGGGELKVRADQFIVAAGTIESTRLLLLLDAASEHRAFAGCDALGRYFQDHLKAEVATISRDNAYESNRLFAYRFVDGTRRDLHLELAAPAQEEDEVASAFAYVSMDLAESPLAGVKKLAQGLQRRDIDWREMGRVSGNLALVAKALWWRMERKQLYVPPSVKLRLMACVEQLPHRKNRIALSATRDRLGLPKALLEWAPTSEDEITFRSLTRNVAAYWTAAGFDRVAPLQWAKCAVDAAIPIISQAEACAHPSGSTRMGNDPNHSVVGADLRCHAVPNVAVVSASVFPTAGSANPTFTIMKLALWLADSYHSETQPHVREPVSAAAG